MNDNCNPEGPRHAQALRLINELEVLLSMSDRMAKSGHAIAVCSGFDFDYWAGECRKVAGQ
jgi:hypothetical protein